MPSDAVLFFHLWLQKPLRIAAITPSTTHLGNAMARLVDLNRPGAVLELGAGTGSLTRGLLRAGCPPEPALRRNLPGISTIVGDAMALADELAACRIDRLCAVVSSLPIKWFPVSVRRAVVEPCFARLGPGGRFLQMTNAFTSPLAIGALGIAGTRIAHVWRNLPPSQIWSYSMLPNDNSTETR